MSPVHIDQAVLDMLREVMLDEFHVLLQTFILDSEERLQLIQQSFEQQDMWSLRQAAHSFKGSCSNMGAVFLASLCQQLEDAARSDETLPLLELLQQISNEFALVRARLRGEWLSAD